MLDYLIKNARIIDGSGSPAFTGCIGIKDGKFVSVRGGEPAIRVIDAADRIAAPGFIDAHSHGDLILGSRDARLFKTQQGVTTELTGQCGLSMAPAAAKNLASVQTLLTMGTAHFPQEMAGWNTFSQWMDYAERCPKTADLAAYVGHSTLRIAVMGMADRPATAHELDIMKGLLVLSTPPAAMPRRKSWWSWPKSSHPSAVSMPAICETRPMTWCMPRRRPSASAKRPVSWWIFPITRSWGAPTGASTAKRCG